MLTLRRRARFADDAGISLIELIVAMGLSVIVMTIAMNFFVGALQRSDAATADSLDSAQARVALDSWSSLLRLADSPTSPGSTAGRFEVVGPTDVVFYADLGNRTGGAARTAPTKIWLSMSNGELVERRYVADNPNADPTVNAYTYSTYPGSPSMTRLLAGCATRSEPCATPGTVGSSSGFTAYYPSTGCPTTMLSQGGLCTIDPAATPSLDDAIAIGLSFTMTSVDGQTTKGFSTLASVTAGSS